MTSFTERLSTVLTGRYRIERELGQGGMATVYLAEDLKHDRRVAIKPVGAGIVATNRTIASRAAAAADIKTANVNWDVFPDSKRMLIIDQGGGIGTRRIALIQNWPALVRQLGAKQ